LDAYNVDLSDLIDNDKTPSCDEVQEIAFQGTDNDYTLTYQENGGDSYREDDVYFTEQDGSSIPLDTTKVKTYLNTLSGLDLTNYVTYNATDTDLAAYGLDEPELTITMQYTSSEEATDETEDDGTFVLHISGNMSDSTTDASSDSEESQDITAYARVGESKIVYQLTTTAYEALMAYTYNDLRHSEIIPAELKNIIQVDITLDGSDYTFTAGDDDTWYYGEEELDSEDLTSALTALSAESFTEEEASDKEEISFTVHLNVAGNPTVQIALYRYDGSDCIATIDGEPIALVARSQVVDLIEAVNAIVLD
jgi:hypothetical protein